MFDTDGFARQQETVKQAVDGVCAKGLAGACLTYWLGSIDKIVAIAVGLATLAYVVLKIVRLLRSGGPGETGGQEDRPGGGR